MKKKLYEKPSSKVIELKHRHQLLVGSALNATYDGYLNEDPELWNE
jgi:hypothetical protein